MNHAVDHARDVNAPVSQSQLDRAVGDSAHVLHGDLTDKPLAPFLLTHELMPLLEAAPETRIRTVSSRSHRNMRFFWQDVMMRRFYTFLLAYKQSKLANVMFTIGLNQRLAGKTNIRAFAIDPGLVNTTIGLKGNPTLIRWGWNARRKKGADPVEAAKTLVHVAGTPGLDPPDGLYWSKRRSIPPSRYAQRLDEV